MWLQNDRLEKALKEKAFFKKKIPNIYFGALF